MKPRYVQASLGVARSLAKLSQRLIADRQNEAAIGRVTVSPPLCCPKSPTDWRWSTSRYVGFVTNFATGSLPAVPVMTRRILHWSPRLLGIRPPSNFTPADFQSSGRSLPVPSSASQIRSRARSAILRAQITEWAGSGSRSRMALST